MEEHETRQGLRLKSRSEPTGRAFNSVFAVADMPTHTGNAYVNAGAIATVRLDIREHGR